MLRPPRRPYYVASDTISRMKKSGRCSTPDRKAAAGATQSPFFVLAVNIKRPD